MNIKTNPSAEQVIAHYSRTDVLDALFQLSRTRRLKFYYRSEEDFNKHGASGSSVEFHCIGSCQKFRHDFLEYLHQDAIRPGMFYPFCNILSDVNKPDEATQLVGWDMRFEIDLDIKRSFTALLPLMAVLSHFDICYLAKFSGHRSLHLIIPAESFPADLRQRHDRAEWMSAVEILGNFLCYFSPWLSKTDVRRSKQCVLTAPYSLHRFSGGVSVPLSLSQAMNFDLSDAAIGSYSRISSEVIFQANDGTGMEHLLETAKQASQTSERLGEFACEVFGNQSLAAVLRGVSESELNGCEDEIVHALFVGYPKFDRPKDRQSTDPEFLRRFCRALVLGNSPEAKDVKLYRLIAPVGYNSSESIDTSRRTISMALAAWVREGCSGLLSHLDLVVSRWSLEAPIAFAVRMLSLVSEPMDQLVPELSFRLSSEDVAKRVMALLCLGELAPTFRPAMRVLEEAMNAAKSTAIVALLNETGSWKVERRPDLVIAVLSTALGRDLIMSLRKEENSQLGRIVIKGVFGDDVMKFEAALNRFGRR